MQAFCNSSIGTNMNDKSSSDEDNCLIDLNDNNSSDSKVSSLTSEYTSNKTTELTVFDEIIINKNEEYNNKIYENNDYQAIPEPLVPPLPIFQRSPKEFKKCEFKIATSEKNKIDFDEFLSKVMNDVISDLNRHKSKLNESQQSNFYRPSYNNNNSQIYQNSQQLYENTNEAANRAFF